MIIKAGTYRFNDVIELPSVDLEQSVSFTCSPIISKVDPAAGTCTVEDGEATFDTVRIYLSSVTNLWYIEYSNSSEQTTRAVYTEADGWNNLAAVFASIGITNSALVNGYGQYITVVKDTEASAEAGEWLNANWRAVTSATTTPTAESVKAKIQGLIAKANNTTGKSDSDLTSGVNSLINGFGDAPLFDGTIEIDGEPAKDYTDYYEEGYGNGYKDGSAAGGNVPSESAELLAAAPFLTRARVYGNAEEGYYGHCGAIIGTMSSEPPTELVILPPWITEVDECFGDVHVTGIIDNIFIFSSPTPPTVGFQGMWSSEGGSSPPLAIFVPDESIEAYKVTTNLAEFADIMKPLSEYNGEGYHGGDWQ